MGAFQIGASSYELAYTPSSASIVGRRLQLQGRLTVKDSRGQVRTRERVRATVVGTQGGIGAAPPRRQEHTSVATATPQLPEVESTGGTSFCGALYIHVEPLTGSALGVSADLSRVQLNARLAPVDESEYIRSRASPGVLQTCAFASLQSNRGLRQKESSTSP